VPPQRQVKSQPTEQSAELQLNMSGLIADQELVVQTKRSLQRLAFVWLTVGNVLLVGILVAFPRFVYHMETLPARTTYKWFATVLAGISVVGSSVGWYVARYVTREARVELQKLRERKRAHHAQGVGDIVGAQRRYRDDISSFIEEYRADANRNRRTANNLQSVIIVGSLITTSATSAVGQAPWIRWVAVLVSLLVAGSAGIAGFFKFRERAMNQRQTADAIEHEHNAADLGIKKYKGMDRDRALAELAENVEMLREEQRKRETQLEQPAETRQGLSQPHLAQ
jgi:hypothetical protein